MRNMAGRALAPAKMAATALAALFLLAASVAAADGGYNRKYEVTITNLTPGQTFTPQLVATPQPQGVGCSSLVSQPEMPWKCWRKAVIPHR